jgi:hypothetical protein
MMFDLLSAFSAWLLNFSALDTAIIVMVLWISTSIVAVTIQIYVQDRLGPIAATLMFGSFMTTALTVAVLLFAGLSQ